MEKLIELLNEYGKEYGWVLFKRDMKIVRMDVQTLEWTSKNSDLIIISKQYGFIKWLVENEKIDRDNVKLRKSLWETDTSDIDKIIYTIKNSDYHYVMREAPYEAEETLLMLLSIQDEPIEFLISILK